MLLRLNPFPGIEIAIAPIPQLATRRESERAAVASLLEEMLGAEAVLAHHPDGAPCLENMHEVEISVSHSRRLAALAVSRAGRVGIDIEAPRPQLASVARRFVGPGDRPRGEGLMALLALWTAKEAAYKTARTPGLGLDEIAVDVAAGEVRIDRCRSTLRALWLEAEGEMVCVVSEGG